MLKLLKNAKVFSPRYLGKKDILVVGDKIGLIDDEISVNITALNVEVYDFSNRIIVPGFIDAHVHITGGGGEGGYSTRTPEIYLGELIKAGITTVVGCLGTDGITRSLENLYAKAKALDEEGITAYIYTGSYAVPPLTFTGDITKDIVIIDKVIGVGEIAISDHRSTQPSIEELKKIVSRARLGGLISGKAGVVNFHVGSGENGIDYLLEIIRKTEIPVTHLYPTHMNRNKSLIDQGIEFAKYGGFFDLTTSSSKEEGIDKTISYLGYCFENKVLDKVTLTSDGQGSLPVFNQKGDFVGLKIGEVSSLFETVKKAVERGLLPFEEALKTVTINPSKVLKLNSKGEIGINKDADIVILNEDLSIDSVIAKGNIVMFEKNLVRKGTFES
ncbi:MAG: beta-aspartyl-peptidase [Thermosipho sp. (in: Bacteria)]|nr:beta-aspartyl-peptidase [Thermosipho sp. (in: thermotogales)]